MIAAGMLKTIPAPSAIRTPPTAHPGPQLA
jgi:hypothetical protein